jgi:histone H3/H4
MISKNSCKKILKSTGLKVEKQVVLKLQEHLNQISNGLTQKMKESTLLRGKKTIQLRDFEYVLSQSSTTK